MTNPRSTATSPASDAGAVACRERFDEWMARVLYDPVNGYYTRNIRGLGRGGDFTTSPVANDRLARAIARWITREQRHHGGAPLPLIEIGPGDGSLAAAVLRQLDHARWLRPWSLLEPRARLHLVDVDSPLRDRQTVRLARFRRRVRWHCSVANALAATGGRALIWSNELVDAFPARVLRWADGDGIGRWQELWVETDAGGLREIWLNFDSGSLSESASAVDPGTWPGGRPPDGQRIEVHESFAGRLREWVPRWRCGSMLTIDYGEEFPAVYHRRPGGTLRAYAHQQRLEGASVYHRMGRQDLTADVNFTDLLTWTQALGLETVRLLSQGEFIGFMAASDGAADTRSEAVGEAEQAFKVLWQRRPAGKTGADGGASG